MILAVGFQHAAKLGITRGSQLVLKATEVAREVIHIMVDRLYPTGNLRFALEANFLYVSFAAAFLVNVSLFQLNQVSAQKEFVVALATRVPSSPRREPS